MDSRKKNRTFFKMQKDKFDRQVTLLRKYYSGTLEKREKQEFREMLKDRNLENVFRQLSQGDILAEKLEEYKQYDARKAFGKFSRQQKSLRHKKRIIRILTAAAVVVLLLGMSWLLNLGLPEVEVVPPAQQETIRPGSYKAILRLTNGETVNLERDSMQVLEKNGTQISYAEGKITYRSTPQIQELAYNELIVPIGGECHVLLDDGTEVWLNAGSRLKYPVAFLGEKRKVIFSGEAFFEVKKDSRPFIVSMETGDVTVLGTSFGIRAYPGETDYTTLVTGKVCFQSKENESVILSPGEQAVLHLAGRLEKREVNVEEYVGWKDGLFVFRNETLSEIMKILGRWYGVNVIFLDDSLKELEYTGNLERYDSINTFLQLLKRLKEVHYEIKGNTVVLYK